MPDQSSSTPGSPSPARPLRGPAAGDINFPPHAAAANATLGDTQFEYTYFGPFPPAEMIARLKEIDPALVDEIIAEFRENGKHVRKLQADDSARRDRALDGEIANKKRAQVCTVIVVIAAFACAAVLGFAGHPAAASIIGGTAVVSLAGMFLLGKFVQPHDAMDEDELEEEIARAEEELARNGS